MLNDYELENMSERSLAENALSLKAAEMYPQKKDQAIDAVYDLIEQKKIDPTAEHFDVQAFLQQVGEMI